MGWVYLLIASVFEVTWVVSMKYSDGFTRLWPSIVTLVATAISFVLLAQAVRTLPVSTGYIVLNGVGAVGAAIFGVFLFGESAHPFRIACVVLVLAGIVGLRIPMSQ
ncbi:MAG TPA: multidrug efflux SMR transporter [Pirellulaceae bacterium]|jgi:quaternary ammonium compound-resistance protein SugE|nr:multidrug efflux SMR transporter [Planctomycetales bacterium]MCB9941615.1 multidrug efflux SMR transporter [Planctomycetaceae bacterium]HRX79804.1 multidrug efflux SMR transporter [Pirellulaceae bacterium]